MTDDELEGLHRRTEQRAWAFLVAALAIGVAGMILSLSKAVAIVVMLPLLVVAIGHHVAMYPMRWVMDRRGIDWDHP
jgi:hypothetical protein